MPADLEETVDCLTALWRRGIPTVVASTGSLPTDSSEPNVTIISTDRLNRVVALDRDSSTLVVEAGVPVDSVREAAKSVGLWCPSLRWLPGSSSIGAAVAGGHGRRSRAYGTVADHILGTRFVSPSVGVVRYGGKAIKNASGYNLSAAIAGSRGELGVILEVTLRLVPKPAHREVRRFQFAPVESAFEFARSLSDTGLEAAAVEIEVQLGGDAAHVLVEVEDVYLGSVEYRLKRLTDRAITLGGQIDESNDWPTESSEGRATFRVGIDPRRFSDVGQSLIARCRDHASEGSLIADTTSGAVELRLSSRSSEGLAAVFEVLPESASTRDLDALRSLLKSAFDPSGLISSR